MRARRGRLRRLRAAPLLLALACARMEPPPGGPPDPDPPMLVGTVPESMAVIPDFSGEVEFRFDEVVSEGSAPSQGTGTSELERLIILSPTDEVPRVRWRRNRITVRPDEGWQPDRVYRVQLLPGVTDLRRNRTDTGTVLTFTTGARLPEARLEGRVIDWTTARPAAGALVVATLLPDSLPYRALADSSGRFAFGPLPAGDYLVSGVLDQNGNRRADGREAFDTARVRRGATEVGELWAFVHDTTPPRIASVTVADSQSARIELAQPMAPGLQLRPADASVLVLPDSIPVPVTSVLPQPLDDSLHRKPAEPADTAAPADTTAARDTAEPRAPIGRGRGRGEIATSRPPLSSVLVLRVGRPWSPGGRYAIAVRGVRNVTGVTGEVRGGLAVPERQAADTLPGARDSVPADTLAPPEPE